MALEALINENYYRLNENDRLVLKYIMGDVHQRSGLSIHTLAKQCAISTSSIVRMTQKLGFAGYGEFKYYLKSKSSAPDMPVKNFNELLRQDIEDTFQYLEQTDLSPIVKLMLEGERIFAYGTGYRQRNMLQEFGANFVSCDRNVQIIPARQELEMQLQYFRRGDVLLIASFSGDIQEYSQCVHALELMKIPVISITSFSNNDLASFTPYRLYYYTTPITPGEKPARISYAGLNVLLESLYRAYLKEMMCYDHHVYSHNEKNG